MRWVIGVAGVVAVLVAACDRPQPVALNTPPPPPPPYPYRYPPPPPPYQYPQPQAYQYPQQQPYQYPPQVQQQQAQQQEAALRQKQQEEAAKAAQVKQETELRNEAAAGYKRVTVKDLHLDGKSYAANLTKLSVFGFYKLASRRDERLYDSPNEYMLNSLNGTDALYIGLLTDNGSREMRAALLSCPAGCGVRLFGHVAPCVETNAFGRTADDFCFVADDISPESY